MVNYANPTQINRALRIPKIWIQYNLALKKKIMSVSVRNAKGRVSRKLNLAYAVCLVTKKMFGAKDVEINVFANVDLQ
jgi:hypothetical protein